ncbi:MAG: mechanosensitive ion channel [Candidatus Babeliaceae bacterium]|nr:mechanosensitive ion channel [Candidatus Babeliaceae bacterium]
MKRVLATLPLSILGSLFLFHAFACAFSIPFGLTTQKAGPETPKDGESILAKNIAFLKQKEAILQLKTDEQGKIIERASTQLNQLKEKTKGATSSFARQLMAETGRWYQALNDVQKVENDTLQIIRDHQKELAQIETQKRASTHQIRMATSFDELRATALNLSNTRERIHDLEKTKRASERDLEKRKRMLEMVSKQLDEKKQRWEQFKQGGKKIETPEGVNADQLEKLINVQLRTLQEQKKLADLKTNESSERIALIATQLGIARTKLRQLEDSYANAKRIVVVSGEQVKKAQAERDEKQKIFFTQRNQFEEQIKALSPALEELKEKFENERAIQGTSLTEQQIREWVVEPDALKTRTDWIRWVNLGLAAAQLGALETKIQLLEALQREAQLAYRQSELKAQILDTWHRLTTRALKLRVSDDLEREIKKYETAQEQLKIDVSELVDLRDKTITTQLRLNSARDTVRALLKRVKQQSVKQLFATETEAQETAQKLTKADEGLRQQINNSSKLIETYTKSSTLAAEVLNQITEIMEELSAKSFWSRPSESIEWSDITNFIPDVARFMRDFKRAGLASLTITNLAKAAQNTYKSLAHIYNILTLLLRLFIIIGLFMLLRIYLPRIRSYLLQGELRYSFLTKLRFFCALIVDWLCNNLLPVYLWSTILILVELDHIHKYFSILFFIISIPLVLFGLHHLITYLVRANRERSFILLSQQLQTKILQVMPLIYLTIILSLFRSAFLVDNYFNSQVPKVLHAVIIALTQITVLIILMSREVLIGKAYVFGIIPRASTLGQWLENIINSNYRYALLTAFVFLIILSNPYIGLMHQIFYVLSRLLITALLIPVILWVYEQIKRIASDFFFCYPEGILIKERFAGGKTGYGLFVLFSFIFFVIFSIILIALVWGYGISWEDFSRWIHYPLYPSGINEATGETLYITAYSLFKIILYLLGGIALVYILNQFVFKRIFDPILVGTGIQNTIMTLNRYVIIILAFLIGLQSVGLDAIAMKIAFVLGAIAYVLKEPIADFFSYFIILVQRPVKIGDYISIEEPAVEGEVRHITPRSTILRRKNSITYIVPNSIIITKAVINWNYAKSFSACDDINVMVPYSVAPEKVKQLLLQVADESTSILKNPTPIVRLVDFSDNGYSFILRCFISSDRVMEKWEIESQIRFAIAKKLREAKVCIASPVRVVSLHSATENNDLDCTIRD